MQPLKRIKFETTTKNSQIKINKVGPFFPHNILPALLSQCFFLQTAESKRRQPADLSMKFIV
jgi:hypothetical protein